MRKSRQMKNAAPARVKLGALAAAIAIGTLASPLRAEDLSQIYAQAREADPTLAGG